MMTTLLHLNQTILDVQEALARERRFAHDTCHALMNGLKVIRESVDVLEREIRDHFENRDRSISCVLGSSQPYTTLIDENAPTSPAIEAARTAPVTNPSAE